LGISSIVVGIVVKHDYLIILYWVPVWMGLFIYDVPLRMVYKSRLDTYWLATIVFISLLVIVLNVLLILPYSIFLFIYVGRLILAKKRMNQIGNSLGILGYVILFIMTMGKIDHESLVLMISFFLFMLGSEFTVRSVKTRNRWLLIYNVIPAFFVLANPAFGIYALSILRIPVALVSKKVKTIGMIETLFLFATTVVLECLYVLKI